MQGLKYSIVLMIIFFALPIFAARPLITDDAKTVPISKHEIELGYDYCRLLDCGRNHTLSFNIKHGLSERFDIGINFPYQIEPIQNEKFGPITLGFKLAIIKELVAVTFANVLGSYTYVLNSIFSKDIGFVDFHLNFGYNTTGKQEERGQIIYALAIEYPLGKFDILGEIFGIEDLHYWLIGGRYNFIIEGLFVDIGYSGNFKNISEKITTGLHYEF